MNNYNEVKNYIHNEAKITKDEIRDIIKETIKQEVRKIVDNKSEYIDHYITEYIQSLVKSGLSNQGSLFYNFRERVAQELSSETGKFIREQLDISVKIKENGEEKFLKRDKEAFFKTQD